MSRDNEHAPVFDFDHNEISLSEATPLNQEIISMAAIDRDEGDNGLIYYAIIDNNNDNKFGIYPDGQVYLADKLDREEKAYYSIIVVATDQGTVPMARSSTSTLVVYVTDENDNTPILDEADYIMYIHENEAPSTVVGRVSASDADVGRNAELSFAFAGNTPAPEYFRIDRQTGFISSKVSIDREALVIATGQDSFQLEVLVSDNGVIPKTATAAVSIVVVDRNDNEPEFSSDSYEAVISEAAKVDTEVVAISATDNDKDANGQLSYRLLDDGQGTFAILEDTGVITLAGELDREAVDKYKLRVEAKDKGIPSRSSTCIVRIEVSDINDLVPKFSEANVKLRLSEGASIGEVVHEFAAEDGDDGENGRLTYFLASGNHLKLFHVDQNTGVMTVNGPLDRETRSSIDLVVTAVDGGQPRALTGSASVTIDITDVNDNAPVFQTSAILVNVKEGTATNTNFYHIEASDPDLGMNGEITYSLKQDNDQDGSSVFRIDDRGDLYTNSVLDREVKDSYDIIVVAQDKGNPPLKSEKAMTIKVEDVNDNAPEVVSLNSALLLPGTPKGSNILTVRATDLDASSNGAVTYKIQDDGSPGSQRARRFFNLDSITGQLVLNQDVPLPERDPLQMIVVASDGAVPSVRKSSTATITVVGGRQQPGPSFTTELYEARINENSPVGTPVGTVDLTDSPTSGGRPQFYIVGCESERGKERGLFEVDKYSGQVRTVREIDREVEGSTILIHIVALVGGNLMSGCKMKVTCLDENDTAPKFDENMNILLSEAFLPGHHVATAKAIDDDLNSILTYSLGLVTQSFMKIDSQTGDLTLTQSIDREQYESAEVVIIVSDGLQTTEWKRNIYVQDVNDNAPEFPAPQFSFDIPESAERGAFVGKIEAVDDDLAEDSQITYTFISDWGGDTFSIDPTSGIITLSGNNLDHEEIEHYILTVSASDSGEPVLTATSTVYINVKDVNDNPPVVEKSLYEVSAAEDVPIGESILQVKATDADSDANTEINFTLDDAVRDIFDISEEGVITTKTRLDREKIPFYAFKVMVTDTPDIRSQLTASCVVQVQVEDVNDMVPQFETIPTLDISENAPPNTPVAAIRALDGDTGSNAEIEYFLEDSLNGKFSIGRIDGVLRAIKSLDREEEDVFKLIVTAIDNGAPRLSSRVEITINVVDMNDNVPTFEQKQYSASVLENASIGMDILQAAAFDLDVGENGRLR